jgi:two-component system response regulator NreC
MLSENSPAACRTEKNSNGSMGFVIKEAADLLHISVKTVETHRAHIMEKLDLHSVSDLVRWAIRNQLIDP